MATALDPLAGEELDRLIVDYAVWAGACFTIRDKHGVHRPLVLNPVQRAIGAAERRMLAERGEARLFVLKGRQGGVSTDQQARALHQIWSEPNFDALTLAQTKEDTEKLFEITKRAIEHFPTPLLPTLGDRETTEISFPRLDARFFTGTAGSKRTGRGLTLKRFHGSEVAFWEELQRVLGTVTPALVPHGSVSTLETTASGFGSEAHEFWLAAERGGNSYRPLFFPWWVCDPANYRLPLLAPDEVGALEEDERALVLRRGLDLEQIKWRRARVLDLGRTSFLQEYAEDAETCWVAAGGMFYDADLLTALAFRAPQPVSVDMGGALEIFGALAPGERAIIGGDTAEGGGGDRSALSVRAFPSFRPLATYASATITPEDLAGVCDTLGRRYHHPTLGPALLILEKNMHGITVLRRLRDVHHYPAKRIFHRRSFDTNRPQQSDRIGWVTTAESKPLMLDAGRQLLEAARAGTAGVPAAGVIRDAFAVRRDATGRPSLTGRDLLVADVLAWIGRDYPVSPHIDVSTLPVVTP